MLENLTFKDPSYLYLLFILPLMGLYYFWQHKRKRNTGLKTSLGLILSGTPVSFRQRMIHLPFILRLLSTTLLILILARPQKPKSWNEVETEGIDIVLTMDISSSMLAKDFEVNRMEASKDVAKEFVMQRENDRIGLVLFSGKSFTQFPLTTDHEVLIKLLEQIKTGMITDGTAIGLGLANAVRNLKNSFSKNKVVILLTDGVNNEGDIQPMEAGVMAKDLGIRVYAIDIRENADIMNSSGEVDMDGQVLRDIASMTGGRYFSSSDKSSLRKVYAEIDRLEKSRIMAGDAGTKDAFVPFAVIAGLFLLAEVVLANTLLRLFPL